MAEQHAKEAARLAALERERAEAAKRDTIANKRSSVHGLGAAVDAAAASYYSFAAEQEALMLTPESRQALAQAAEEQKKVAAAADAATADEKHRVGWAYTDGGLKPLESLLDRIDLIDVNYLISLAETGAGVVPCWQDVPDAARINAANVWRLRGYNSLGVPILVLSYPWLDRHHPDKLGATLQRILPILRACREEAARGLVAPEPAF